MKNLDNYRKYALKKYHGLISESLAKRNKDKKLVGYLFYSNGSVKSFHGSKQQFREITKHLRK